MYASTRLIFGYRLSAYTMLGYYFTRPQHTCQVNYLKEFWYLKPFPRARKMSPRKQAELQVSYRTHGLPPPSPLDCKIPPRPFVACIGCTPSYLRSISYSCRWWGKNLSVVTVCPTLLNKEVWTLCILSTNQ